MAEQVFISYSSKDQERVFGLTDRLRSAGISVWVDQSGIGAATLWSKEIASAIKGCKVLVLMVTPNSVTSRNVTREVSLASEQNKPILPVLLESTQIPEELEYHLAGIQHLDVAGLSPAESVQEILPTLQRLLGSEGVEVAAAGHSVRRTRRQPAVLWGDWRVYAFSIGLATLTWILKPSATRLAGAGDPGMSGLIRMPVIEMPKAPPEGVVIDAVPRPAISPDGRWIAYMAGNNREIVLWELENNEQTRIDKTRKDFVVKENPIRSVFFSPDSRFLCYCGDTYVRQMEIASIADQNNRDENLFTLPGQPSDPSVAISGAAWISPENMVITLENRNVILVHSGENKAPLEIQPSFAEPPEDSSTVSYANPEPAEGTPHVIATRLTDGAVDIVRIHLDTGEASVLVRNAAAGRLFAPGYLLFIQNNSLYAVRFDRDGGRVIGEKTLIEQGVAPEGGHGASPYAVSAHGLLVFRRGFVPNDLYTRFVWVNTDGREEGAAEIKGEIGTFAYSLSPREERVVVLTEVAGVRNVCVVDLRNPVPGRRTAVPVHKLPQTWEEAVSYWSGDGYVYFTKRMGDRRAIVRSEVDAFKEPEIIHQFDGPRIDVNGATPDGSTLLVSKITHSPQYDPSIHKLAAKPGAELQPFFDTPGHEGSPTVSPDGRWVAFQSVWLDGQWTRIFVKGIDEPPGPPAIPMSTGTEKIWHVTARWNPLENTLYFLGNANPWIVMEVPYAIEGSEFKPTTPRELFRKPSGDIDLANYQINHDGTRFLARKGVVVVPQETTRSTSSDKPLTLVTGLHTRLKEVMGSAEQIR
ncbi:MAG: TIR domain-containing protein [Verrucomicrobia bacterium]|nr:TIR domain-containing protein [Verrucomicrobiota bacterium]